jgi:hypothetical protein
LAAGHVLPLAVKLGKPARRVRPAPPRGWSSRQVEVARLACPAVCLVRMVQARHPLGPPPGWTPLRVLSRRLVELACLCLVQMVKARHASELGPDWLSLRVLSLQLAGLACLCLAQMVKVKPLLALPLALLSRPGPHDRVCPLGWAKLALPGPSRRPQPLDLRQPLVVDRPVRARPRQLAAECSWDFRS